MLWFPILFDRLKSFCIVFFSYCIVLYRFFVQTSRLFFLIWFVGVLFVFLPPFSWWDGYHFLALLLVLLILVFLSCAQSTVCFCLWLIWSVFPFEMNFRSLFESPPPPPAHLSFAFESAGKENDRLMFLKTLGHTSLQLLPRSLESCQRQEEKRSWNSKNQRLKREKKHAHKTGAAHAKNRTQQSINQSSFFVLCVWPWMYDVTVRTLHIRKRERERRKSCD